MKKEEQEQEQEQEQERPHGGCGGTGGCGLCSQLAPKNEPGLSETNCDSILNLDPS